MGGERRGQERTGGEGGEGEGGERKERRSKGGEREIYKKIAHLS